MTNHRINYDGVLVGRVQKLEPPLPDDVVLPIYRDADVNRDHTITAKEAETFYKEYVLRFEDALGALKY
jgi:ABC-type transporter Mla subunit MlaD